MPITTNDIKLLASARMSDAADGGGQMTGTPLQDGAENNVFLDVSSTDRAFGRLSLRKVYPAVLNNGTDTLLGAHVILDDMPDDANVEAFAFPGNSVTESRAAVLPQLENPHWSPSAAFVGYIWAATPYAVARIKVPDGRPIPWVGQVLHTAVASTVFSANYVNVLLSVTEISSGDGTFSSGFSSMTTGDRVFAVTYEGPTPTAFPAATITLTPAAYYGTPFISTKAVSGTLSTGASQCDVSGLLVPLVPKQVGAEPGSSAQIGINPTLTDAGGRVPAFRPGDGLVVHHTGVVAAATYANGNTVSCGRTNLANVRIIGSDGASIPAGWSVNLATGVVTVSDITGWAQPVTVRHTIEEVLSCSRTSYAYAGQPPLGVPNRVVFNRPLTRDFPSGTLLSSMLLLGDLQARAGQSFSQEAWTSVWSDTRIGTAIAPQYQQVANPIVVTNAGALSELWALIFTTSTTFRIVGQTLGQIGTGDINTACAPINPATTQPYFTIQEEGWGSGWSGGNVLRFNTTGANAPIWVGRAVLPSAPSGTPDSLTVAIRGDIDA